MKHLLTILMVSGFVFLPTIASADTLTYEEAWGGYLYEMHLAYAQGVLAQDGPYYIASGEVPEFPSGPWKLDVLDSQDRILYTRSLNPSGLTASQGVLFVPYHDSGTTMLFTNAAGATVLTVDLTGSRVCNDNGSCESRYGENTSTCPGDCGGTAQQSDTGRNVQAANIATQSGLGRQFGSLLLRISSAAAGLIMLVGVARLLDSRRAA